MPEIIKEEKYSKSLGKMILDGASNEKDPENIPTFFELVAICLKLILDQMQTVSSSSEIADCSQLSKAIAKSFRKACYGAPAERWVPIVLPLSASFPRSNLNCQVQMLKALVSKLHS